MFRKKHTYFIALLILHTLLACLYIANRDITFDEPEYFEYSKHWLHGNPERTNKLYDSKTPMTVIAWIPRIVEQIFNKDVQYNDWGKSDQQAGRYLMIFFTLITAIYLFLFSKRLMGERWALLPVALFLFDPLVLAHSGVIGSDMASAMVYLAVLFHLWRYLLERKQKDFLLLSILLGIACITKQNLVLLLFIVPVILFVGHLKKAKAVSFFSWRNIGKAFLAMVIVWFVINAAFYFYGSFNTLSSYNFQSSSFKGLQKSLGFLHNCPMLFPQPFIRGFDMIKFHAEIGGGGPLSTYNSVIVCGHESTQHGFWFYYLATGFFKMPVPTILLSVAGSFAFVYSWAKRKAAMRTEWWVLLLPSLVFFFIMSCFNNFQIGIRHIIFLLPPLFIFLVLYIKHLVSKRNRKLQIALYTLAAWQIISVTMYFNNYMAYTNEFVLNKTHIIEWISDSGLDYGQSNSFVGKYINDHPGFSLPDSIPAKGKFAVKAVQVLHVNKNDTDKYAWLRENYKPFGNYKGTIWLYDIPQLKDGK